MDWLASLFDPTLSRPRRECSGLSAEWITLHTASDLLIWLAYLSIPLILLVTIRRQTLTGLRTPVVLFALFILACGTSHLVEAVMFDYPLYRLSGVVKSLTAAVSWLTVFIVVPIVPKVLARLGPVEDVLGKSQRSAASTWVIYLFAVLVAVAVVMVRFALNGVLGDLHPFHLPLLGVVLVAWYGGFRPGMVTLAVTTVLIAFLFLPPQGSFVIERLADVIGIALFLFTGLGVCVLGQLQQTAHQRLLKQMAVVNAASTALAEEKQAADRALGQLDALVRNAPYGIAFLDDRLQFVRVNDTFALHSGVRVPDHFGRTLTDLAPDYPPEALAEYHEVLAGGVPQVGRVVPRGNRVWEVTAFQVPVDQDRMGLGLIGKDVTERHTAAERVRQSEAKFRAVADGIPQLAWMARPDGHIFWYNQRWYDYTGTTPEEMEGWGWQKVHDPEEVKRVMVTWPQALASGEPFEDTFPLRRHDGQMRWHLTRAVPSKDADGNVLLWFGTNTDVTAQRELEQTVREAQRFTESVLHSLPGHLAVTDEHGQILTVNESWRQFGQANGVPVDHDWTRDNYFDASLRDKSHGERAVAGIRAVARGERGAFEMEYPCHAPSQERYFLLRANRFRGDGPLRLVITHENITDRVQAEREVRERASQLVQLTEGMPFLMWACQPSGECDYLSRQWVEYTGIRGEDHLSDGWLQAVHPDDREATVAAWQSAVQSDGVHPYEVEFRLRRHDGAYRWFAVRGIPLRDGGGRIVRWYGSCADIDDRKRQADTLERLVTERTAALHEANAELVQQRSFVDAILDNMAEGIVACDADGRLKLFNAATRHMHGLDAESLPPERWADRYSLFEADGVTPLAEGQVPLVRAWRGEVIRDAEMVIRPADPTQSERYVLCSGQPLRTPAGELFGAVVSMRDTTERREYERQLLRTTAALEASNEDLEKFAYIASHDLQEPLRKIQAFGDRLATKFRESLGDQGKDYVDRMLDSAGRMRRLIEDLLAFSRVNTRSRPSVPVALGEVVRDVLSDLEEQLRRTGGRVVVGQMPKVAADPAQVGQLFQNLIGNALKFNRPGTTPEVSVSAEPLAEVPADATPPPPDWDGWRIRVVDNGIGFEPEHTDRIFELFQRLHGRSKYEGTGLGLAIVKKIVARHGGAITARGRPGEGAEFIIDWPNQTGGERP